MNRQVATHAPKPTAVINVAGGVLQRKCACGTHTVAGGECKSCRKGKTFAGLQRAAISAGAVNEVPLIVHDVLRSSGQPLDADARSLFESRFGHDFSHVRVHTDARAAESAQAVNALAYTVGREVVFAANQYTPHTPEGRRLLAHELTHVLQQSHAGNAPAASLKIGSATDPSESAAEDAAHQVLNGATPDVAPSAPMLRRQLPEERPLPPTCNFVWKDGKPHVNCERLPLPSPLPKDTPDIPLNPEDWPKPGDIFNKGGDAGGADCRGFPGFKPGGSKEFKEQCCRGTESKENCCPPERLASKELRCCPDDTAVQDGQCVKGPTIVPGPLCLPPHRTVDGRCCTPPAIAVGTECKTPSVKPTGPTAQPLPPLPPSLEIFFERDMPQPGQAGSDKTVLTDKGRRNLPGLAAALRNDPTLKIQLIGTCSIEGAREYNYLLGRRRAEWVVSRLRIDASRLIDPPENDLQSECRPIGTGLFTCGEAGADSPDNPLDRRVLVRFFKPGPN